jgi:hypothetical protein
MLNSSQASPAAVEGGPPIREAHHFDLAPPLRLRDRRLIRRSVNGPGQIGPMKPTPSAKTDNATLLGRGSR